MPDDGPKNNPRNQPIDQTISAVNKRFGDGSLMRMGDAKRNIEEFSD
ncbi:MAG: DNA recombination/repair protein RecA [Puniceicoccales bacterium]|jgi:hypothetical protein|nr:DNA recombination/repair protein RecA [Puniceicoccales bacterium]